jgi:hypothetical protein
MKPYSAMNIGIAIGGLVAAGATVALAAPAAAQSPTTTTTLVSTPPIQGTHPHHIDIFVDTVTGGGTPKPLADCLQENQFVRGQLVVFRMYADDISAGGLALTDRNTEAAYVTIPGKGKIAMAYSAHEKIPAYWEVPWSSAGYPLGTVNFTVTVVAKPLADWGVPSLAGSTVPAQATVYRQSFSSGSDLTIVAP